MHDAIAAEADTLFAKIWRQHTVHQTGDVALILVDRIFLHERTGALALKSLRRAGRPLADRSRVFCTMDHIVDTTAGRGDDTRVPGGREFIREMREAAREARVRVFDVQDPQQGIVHVISPEMGIALPGATVVCPDSHTCTQGALGALAWGIGTTEAEHALATGTLQMARAMTLRVSFEGRLGPGVTAKDLSLRLISSYGSAGGNGYAVEYAGGTVRGLDMDARLTLCNMTTEFSAVTGFMAPDDTTFAYLEGRPLAPRGELWNRALDHWRELYSAEDARFDREIRIEAGEVAPMITWGTSPQHAVSVTGCVPESRDSNTTPEAYERAIAYMGVAAGTPLAELEIDAAFIGSCTNSRIGDLRRAAAVLRGRKVAGRVNAVCVPGSMATKRAAEAEGLDEVFKRAGFQWRESGCSMCFYAGGESFLPGARVVSSTNRNFESRQGPGTRTHIASPETVAASAVAGRIADVRELLG
jgi:3-isopropylmalate/(R)-2-methylmalate dehydratase large subunit